MKHILKNLSMPVLCLALLTLNTSSVIAQEKDKKSDDKLGEYDQIIIKWKNDKGDKDNKDAKVTIEIKDDKILVNGKPLAEFNDDQLSVLKRDIIVRDGNTMRIAVPRAPRSPFQGGEVFGWDDDDHTIEIISENRGFLGVNSEKTDNGVKITEVTKGSAAEKAGLKVGDIITKVDEVKISDPGSLAEAIGKYNPEEKVTITYKREGSKEKMVTATLGKRPGPQVIAKSGRPNMYALPPGEKYNFNFDHDFDFDHKFNFDDFERKFDLKYAGQPKLGIKAQDTEDGKGVKVLDIEDESAAEKAGLKEGDIITSFDGKEINSVGQLMDITSSARDAKKQSIPLKYRRNNVEKQAEIKIPRKLKTAEL